MRCPRLRENSTTRRLMYLMLFIVLFRASLVSQLIKNALAKWETWSNPWVGKIP